MLSGLLSGFAPVTLPLFHGIRLAEVIRFSVLCMVALLCY